MKTVNIRCSPWFIALFLLSGSMAANAANIVWTNTASGNWNATNSWSPNQVPSTNDTVYITNSGTYTVTLNINATVSGLVLGTSSGVTTQTFSISSVTFTLNGQATVSPNGAFNFISGNLAGAAVLAGAMSMQTVTLMPAASLTVSATGVLNINGASEFNIEGPLTNNGTVNWTAGSVQIVNNNSAYMGAVWNQAGAQWYIECNQTLVQDFGPTYEIFHNAGLLCKTNVTGSTAVHIFLDNTGGTVQTQIGMILFSGGGNLLGTYQAAAGTSINFQGGNYVWDGTAVFQGPGIVAITGGNVAITTAITSPFTASGVTLSNLSNLGGSAYLTNVAVASAETIVSTNIVWGSGSITATGSLTVAANAVLNIVTGGTGIFQFEGPWTNNGMVNWLGDNLNEVNDNNVNYRGAIWNQPGAQWFIQCSQGITDSQDSGLYEIFHNRGLLCKTNVAGSSLFQVFLDNTGGTVQAQIGTINFANGCNLAGTFQAASGAAITFSAGNFVWNGTAVFQGPGSVGITGGNVAISTFLTAPFTASGVTISNLSNLGGTAYLTNVTIGQAETIVGTICWDGAPSSVTPAGTSLTVATNGVLNIAGPSNFQLEGPLTNNGTVNWLGGPVTVVNDNNITFDGVIWNQAGAKWYIQCSATMQDSQDSGKYEVFNNAGLLCKTNVAGSTGINVYLNNTGGTVQAQIGTINIENGCNLLGIFQAASGAAINFNGGNYLWNGTANFQGPGSVGITGGTVTITTYLTSPNSFSGVTISNLSNLGGTTYLTNVTIGQAETIVGTIYWDGAPNNVTPPGTSLTVSATGVLNIAGPSNFQLEGPLTNNGTVNWLGGSVTVVNDNNITFDGVIWNQAGAKWYIQCSATMQDSQDSGKYEVFNNAGLLCKTNVTGSTGINVYLNNTGGTVQAQIGTINIENGCNLLGIFQAASGAAINFSSGNYLWNGMAAFEGPGFVGITGGTVTITTYLTSPNSFSGVTISNLSNLGGTTYLTNVTIGQAETIVGTIYWDGAPNNVTPPGTSLTVSATGVLNIAGPSNFQLEGPLTNNGTVNWLGGQVTVVNDNNMTYDGVIWNQAGAKWYIQCNQTMQDSQDSGKYEVFNNAGLLCKTNVTGSTGINVYLNNTGGTVQAQIGTINIENGCNLLGIFQAASGAAINFSSGNYLWNGTANFQGPGSVGITGGTVTITTYLTSPNSFNGVTISNLSNLGGTTYLTNVTIAQAETIVGTIYWDGAPNSVTPPGTSLTVATNGVLNIVGPSSFQLEGPLTNNGTVNWLGGGVTVVNNNNITYNGAIWNQAGANWYIQCSQTMQDSQDGGVYEFFHNAGLLCKTNVTGTTTFDVALNNTTGTVEAGTGLMDFNNGYTLGAGGTLSFGLNSLANYGQITLAGTAALNGSIGAHLNGGYVPVVSNAFTLLNYSAFTGGFTNTNLPSVAIWQTTNAATALTIKVLKLVPQLTWPEPANIVYGTKLSSAQLDATAASPTNLAGTLAGNFVYTPPLNTILNSGSNQTLSVTFTPTDTASNSTATTNVTINVLQAPLTITATNRSKTYGQTETFAGTEFVPTGLTNGDTVTSASITSAGDPPTAVVSGSPYTITITNAVGDAGLTNYIITYATGNLTVTQAPMTVTATIESKIYGQTVLFGSGSTLFTTSTLSNSETIGTVTLTVTGNGGVSNAPVGAYTLTPSAAAGGSGTEANYNISYVTSFLVVNEAPLTLTANAENKNYGQTVPFGAGSTLFTAALSNNETIGTVTLAVTGNGGASNAPIGSYKITPSAALGGSGTESNYNIIYVTNTLTVSAAPLTVTANPQSKTYGQTVTFGSGSTLFTAALSNNETIGTVTLAVTGNGGVSNAPVGSYTITPSAATGGSGTETNYSITYVTNTLTVNAAALTITANAENKTYGQVVAFGPGSTLFSASTLSNNETIGTVTLSVSGNGGAASAPVGSYIITPSAATGGSGTESNYNITYVTNALTVGVAPLTVTANAENKTYGQTVPFGSGSTLFTSTLSNSETIGTVTLSVTGNGGASNAPIGNYRITPSAAMGGSGTESNYNITYITNTLTVSTAPLIVTANPRSKTYGQTVTFGSGSVLFTSSLSNNETIGSVTLAVTGNGGVSNAPVGIYTITPSAATGGSGTETNYIITYVTNTLTVNAAALTITANAQSKTYGQTVVFGSGSTLFTASTLSNNETIGTVTLAVSANGGAGSAPVGSYTITPSAATGGSGTETNYTINYVTNTLTVGAASLIVGATAQGKTYGQTVVFGAGSVLFTNSVLSNSETIGTVTLAVSGNGGVSNAPVGLYTITPSAATGGSGTETNYNITYLTNTLTVSAAPLMVAANPQSKTYGQTVVFGSGSTLFTASLSNNETIGSVTLAVTGNGGASNAPVGTYKITPSAATGGSGTESNYSISYMTNTLIVSAAPLVVTANAQSKTYGQTVAFGSGSVLFTTSTLSNNETIGTVTLSVSGNGGAGSAPVGSYTITPSAATGGSGTESNYSISYVANTLTVNAALLTITANPQTKTFGQTIVFGSGSTLFTSSTLSNNETIGSVTLAAGNGGASNAPAGSYTITPSAAMGGSGTEMNYSISYVTNTLTVTLPTLYLQANPSSIILSWTTNAGAFVLNKTANLASPVTWTPITSGIITNGTNYTITLNDSSGNQFYALISGGTASAPPPPLAIALVKPNTVVVSWPATGSYTLQQTADLATTNWLTSGYSIVTANGTNSITITPATGNQYFRLSQP